MSKPNVYELTIRIESDKPLGTDTFGALGVAAHQALKNTYGSSRYDNHHIVTTAHTRTLTEHVEHQPPIESPIMPSGG